MTRKRKGSALDVDDLRRLGLGLATSRRRKPHSAAPTDVKAARATLGAAASGLPQVFLLRRFDPGVEDEAGLICNLTTERRSRHLDPTDTLLWNWSELRAALLPEHYRIVETLYRELARIAGQFGWASDALTLAQRDLDGNATRCESLRTANDAHRQNTPVADRICEEIARRQDTGEGCLPTDVAEAVDCDPTYVRRIMRKLSTSRD
jgi:hypothetical protein